MKIPCVIDLRKPGTKRFIDNIIKTYGKAKDVNQVGLRVDCEDEAGTKFHLLQFNSSRHLVTIGSESSPADH